MGVGEVYVCVGRKRDLGGQGEGRRSRGHGGYREGIRYFFDSNGHCIQASSLYPSEHRANAEPRDQLFLSA